LDQRSKNTTQESAKEQDPTKLKSKLANAKNSQPWIPPKWEEFDPSNFVPILPQNHNKAGQRREPKANLVTDKAQPTPQGNFGAMESKPQTKNTANLMVFNNPEFITEFNEKFDNQTTSSMDEDDIYDWSKHSVTPSNKLSSNKQQQFVKLGSSSSLHARFSGGFPQQVPESGARDQRNRQSLGEDTLTPKGLGSSSSL